MSIPVVRKEKNVYTEKVTPEELGELIVQAERNIGVLTKKTKMPERAKSQSLKYWYFKLNALKMKKVMLETELKKQSKDNSVPTEKS